MFVIKIGNYKLKVLNLLVFILFIVAFLYLLTSIMFMFPCFNGTKVYKENYSNYKLTNTVKFKRKWISCSVIETLSVNSDKNIYNYMKRDLLNDNYINKKDNLFYKKTKYNKSCKFLKNEFDKSYSNKITFKLNGSDKENVIYNNNYIDKNVVFTIDKKPIDKISILSNYNSYKIGNYVISYKANISKYHNKYLYREVNLIDNLKPIITLKEGDLELDYGSRYVEPGYTATDNYDGDITDNVKVSGKVNNKKPGTYKINYEVKDTSNNKIVVSRYVKIKEKSKTVSNIKPNIENKNGITYVNGILIVNKKYSLPKTYNPGTNKEAYNALKQMQADAKSVGLDIPLISGFRSYERQLKLYNNYVKKDGKKLADTYSSKPGHSEHQTGLTFDIGSVKDSFKNTKEAKWIKQNAHLYGFIVRYPEGKEAITGYKYEPWHIRYLGKDIATKVSESGLCLEEYLHIN